MKDLLIIAPLSLLWMLSFIPQTQCVSPVNCQWGPYGEWSPCDGCTKTQTRVRSIVVYPQFGGTPCSGGSVQTQPCETAQGCPLEQGCGNRFRCQSGTCISKALVCNGDSDCEEDNLDEHNCKEEDSKTVCDLHKPPPLIEVTGLGFDVVKGQRKGSVINTKSFGGLCNKVFSGDHRKFYRLPQSVLQYSFQVKAESDFSDEFFKSTWSYVKQIQEREQTTGTTKGYRNYDFKDALATVKGNHLIVIKSDIEVAQFQNRPPEYLPLSEEFWRALSTLPVVYDYAAYRKVLERFGTHFPSSGTLGGKFRALLNIDTDIMEKELSQREDFKECVTRTHTIFFFFKKTTTKCRDYNNAFRSAFGHKNIKDLIQAKATGGYLGRIAALEAIKLETAHENTNKFSDWAGSVKEAPVVIKQKLRPLYELVKEVSCAGIKKYHLKRATETYLMEKHPCHCQACQNNGEPEMGDNDVCTCVCKPGTEGPGCQIGKEVDQLPGLIHGGWTCWSAWSGCSGGRKRRTRTCSRPTPSGGGKYCNGEPVETSPCDGEEDLNYLREMEPHCFDSSLMPRKTCGTPPSLVNGFVLQPRDVYIVGSKIEYTCIEGYHLLGDPIAECTEDQKWERHAMECRSTMCWTPLLPDGIAGSPLKSNYIIGETVQLSCPAGGALVGPAEIQCSSSLFWIPNPKDVTCQGPAPTKIPDEVLCQPWEKKAKDKCVCKVPYECKPSLEVCATSERTRRTDRLTACKVHALWCLGQKYSLAEDGACKLSTSSDNSCPDCQLWESCDEQTGKCRCKTPEECSSLGPWIQVCARLDGGSEALTLTECEAGLWRCKGKQVQIISLQRCQSEPTLTPGP
ncbi:complement component C7 [Chanos chanos]|uniref:Complement component C7 n=1 Tax=Chanos chanos TaxID=29144 RepID=A0A6J2UND4_CHACN|nr:complement component C7-like [Chanos chanos]